MIRVESFQPRFLFRLATIERRLFRSALKVDAKAVIVAHNHPSGDPTASVQDKILTDELMRLGATLGVEVLDHLIVAGDKWTSCTRR